MPEGNPALAPLLADEDAFDFSQLYETFKPNIEVDVTSEEFLNGEPVVIKHHMSKRWCDIYLAVSGDENHEMHRSDMNGMLQGMALLTIVGTVISKVLPGYAFGGFKEARFKQMVHVGSILTITLKCSQLRANGRVVFIEVNVDFCEEPVTTPVELIFGKKS